MPRVREAECSAGRRLFAPLRQAWLVLSVIALGAASCERMHGPGEGERSASTGRGQLDRGPELVRREALAMGTVVQIASYTSARMDAVAVEAAQEAAFAEMRRLEAILSSWRQDSDVGRINAADGSPVPVRAETIEVMQKAQWMGALSGGAFDVTFQVLSDLWRFGDAAEETPRVPRDDQVAARAPLIDFRRIELDENNSTIRLPDGMQLSFGGIAKGYIVDKAASVLRRRGVRSFFVQAGGDLLSVGRKPGGEAWRSGIQDPRAPRGEFFAVVDFSDHAFSTAGDYARAYFAGGRRYHHIIDPKTGHPARRCRSVTVWAPDALTADALDDAVFVMGPSEGLALIERVPGVGALIVDERNRVLVSQRLASRVEVLRQPMDGP